MLPSLHALCQRNRGSLCSTGVSIFENSAVQVEIGKLECNICNNALTPTDDIQDIDVFALYRQATQRDSQFWMFACCSFPPHAFHKVCLARWANARGGGVSVAKCPDCNAPFSALAQAEVSALISALQLPNNAAQDPNERAVPSTVYYVDEGDDSEDFDLNASDEYSDDLMDL